MPRTIRELIECGQDDAPAICGQDLGPLDYRGLRVHVDKTVAHLRKCGIGRGDRVAIVLPNGPEMATAFVSVASGAVSAPLNPSLRQAELEYLLTDLRAKALIVLPGHAPQAEVAARACAVPIMALEPAVGGAGRFGLSGKGADCGASSADGSDPREEDVALLLHTSGTTARPKLVPLSHRNLCASVANLASALELTARDRCFNIMPLFHIHGLVAALLASLAGGGSIHASPGFNALQFFEQLGASGATWCTAVPTMLQAVLARAAPSRTRPASGRLRFVRSCSAPLLHTVWADVESLFDAPVINCYGMTEASHQITGNPLPPRRRLVGTVGVASGTEVAIMDEAGRLLPSGAAGEVVIRGEAVTTGYLDNPEANRQAFIDGWFRTGDQGIMDRDGYLTLVGRLKEMINRGGEKISPLEIEEILLRHGGVAQAVAFAVPHELLGEEVGAAVMAREGLRLDAAQLRDFVAAHLAKFKVPKRILVVDQIPMGPTGKLQRIGLAKRLGLV